MINKKINKIQTYLSYKKDPSFATFESLNNIIDKLETASESFKLPKKISIDGIESSVLVGPPGKDAIVDYEKIKLLIPEPIQGEPGKQGPPGKDAVVDYDKIKSLIPDPIPGPPGKDAVIDEKKIITKLLSKIELPKPIDEELIVKKILNIVPNRDNIVEDIISKIPDQITKTPEELARSLETLTGNDRLDYNSLKNIPGVKTYSGNKMRGGGDTIEAGQDIDITKDANGVKTISVNECRLIAYAIAL